MTIEKNKGRESEKLTGSIRNYFLINSFEGKLTLGYVAKDSCNDTDYGIAYCLIDKR